MITTNNLVSYTFSGITGTPPTTWDLSEYIPEGILLLEHLTVRWRSATAYWTGWQPVTAFDKTTQIATKTVPNGTITVEFRRQTPRYSLVRDPLARTDRVSAPYLQINADQGLMVGLEWAGEYGVNGHDELVSGLPPVTIGRAQGSQNHYGPDTDFTKQTWNFFFAGGYLDMSHVKAQVKIDDVWQGLTIDYTPWDDDTPNASPFKFIGPYQLHLDLSTLGADIQGMVIYRRTPRESNVFSPTDAARITAQGMEPSAVHAFFVAVELGEEFSRNVPECECLLVFTSKPYDLETPIETLGFTNLIVSINLAPPPFILDKVSFSNSVLSGVLRTVVQSYTLALPDKVSFSNALTSGVLTLVVKQYTDALPDKVSFSNELLSGSVVLVVQKYINALPDKVSFSNSVLSGVLV